MPDKSLKAADKQQILKKLVTEMKRRYSGSVPKHQRSTFETILFAICLEDCNHKEAEAAYGRMLESFFDLNEIRVSSVTEIERSLGDIRNADWKAMRIREVLQYTFEKYYAFDLEPVRRKTQEAAVKELSQIPHQTSYVRAYVIHHSLEGHVLPVDRSIHKLLIWLGLADAKSDPEGAGEELKHAFKKSEGDLLSHLLKCVATDPVLREAFEKFRSVTPLDPFTAPERLVAHFKNPQAANKKKKKPDAKSVSKKKPEKKLPVSGRTKGKPPAAKASKKVTKKRPEKKSAKRRK